MEKFYLTTPLYYPNARPHVGSAYTTIVCDAIARYKRMCGYDVAFLTGTDEHGEKLERAAAAAGMTPQAFVAEKRELFRDLWKTLGIDYTHFVYTDQPDHVKSVQRMLLRAREAGYIDKRRYEGRYCIFDEMYVSDGSEPVNCPNCGRPAELISEENYFFRLSAFQERLLDLYDKQPDFVQPDFRMNEVKSLVKSGLRDISVSRRRIKWGIPWPDDPEQVFYVWYDALTGYLTGIGYAEDGDDDIKRRFERGFWEWWPDEGPLDPSRKGGSLKTVVHMIGKDILRFHAVYWPAFLMAAEMVLPTTVFAHGWIYYEQDKMSKSKGNVVYPEPIVEALNSFGAPGNDALRYYLLRDTPFGLDGSFSYEGLIQRYNSDLANGLGNLASRTIAMLWRNCGGRAPVRPVALTKAENQLREDFFGSERIDERGVPVTRLGLTFNYLGMHFERFQLSLALVTAEVLVSRLNKYLVEEGPWKIAESWSAQGASDLSRILYTATDLLRTITILVYPFIPEGATRLWQQLGGESKIEDCRFSDLKWQDLEPGTNVGKPEPIFPRLDKEATLRKLHELAEEDRLGDTNTKEATIPVESQPDQKPVPAAPAAPNPTPEAAPQGEQKITIDDFAKVDLRAGTILSAEPIPGATKLLKLQVDIGTEVRQVCAGIAEFYKPEDLIGMKIVLVANLQPRKLRGVESNGMVLAASVGENGRPILATFKEDVVNGTKLK